MVQVVAYRGVDGWWWFMHPRGVQLYIIAIMRSRFRGVIRRKPNDGGGGRQGGCQSPRFAYPITRFRVVREWIITHPLATVWRHHPLAFFFLLPRYPLAGQHLTRTPVRVASPHTFRTLWTLLACPLISPTIWRFSDTVHRQLPEVGGGESTQREASGHTGSAWVPRRGSAGAERSRTTHPRESRHVCHRGRGSRRGSPTPAWQSGGSPSRPGSKASRCAAKMVWTTRGEQSDGGVSFPHPASRGGSFLWGSTQARASAIGRQIHERDRRIREVVTHAPVAPAHPEPSQPYVFLAGRFKPFACRGVLPTVWTHTERPPPEGRKTPPRP